MIKHNKYKIIFGYKAESKIGEFVYNSKLERDNDLLGMEDSAIALIDIELEFDENYQLLSSNTSSISLTQNTK